MKEKRSIPTRDMNHDRPIVFGEVLFDRFPDGAVLGGAPFNVAWHLKGLGFSPLFVSRVGDDGHGEQVKQAMRGWGMDVAGLQTDASHPTGMVDIELTDGRHTFDILPDQAYDYIDADLARAAATSVDAALIYHGTLIARTDRVCEALDDLLPAIAAPVFLDVNLRDPWWRAEHLPRSLERARWVKVNNEELDIISDHLGQERRDLAWNAQRLQADYDIELLIVTRGANGAIAFDHEGATVDVVPKKQSLVIDTVGAGDAFTSMVLVGLLQNWPLEQTVERAQAFASRICGQRGATSPNRQMYRDMLGQPGDQTSG